MAEERDGINPEEPSDEYREFRRMMNSADRAGPSPAGRAPGREDRGGPRTMRRPATTGGWHTGTWATWSRRWPTSTPPSSWNRELRPGPPRPGHHQPQSRSIPRPRPPGLRCRHRPGPGQRRRAAGPGRGPGQHGPPRRGDERPGPVPGPRPGQRGDPHGPGADPHQPGAARAGDGGLHQGPRPGPRQHGRPLQPGHRQHAPGAARAGHRGLQRRHRDRTRTTPPPTWRGDSPASRWGSTGRRSATTNGSSS